VKEEISTVGTLVGINVTGAIVGTFVVGDVVGGRVVGAVVGNPVLGDRVGKGSVPAIVGSREGARVLGSIDIGPCLSPDSQHILTVASYGAVLCGGASPTITSLSPRVIGNGSPGNGISGATVIGSMPALLKSATERWAETPGQ
jgi:hypothetical protein